MSEKDLYKVRVLQYFQDKRFSGALNNPNFYAEQGGIFCSDRVELFLNLADHKIQRLNFLLTGCIIATACAAMLAEFCEQNSLAAVLALEQADFLNKVVQLPVAGSRQECATLAFILLKKMLPICIA
jgi:NifU-like protein involved in Fe-S cluster formation